MRASLIVQLAGLVSAVAFVALGVSSAAIAAPPSNDDFASATVVASFPFSHIVDITDATFTADDNIAPYGIGKTVRYSFTASANATIEANPAGSDFFDSSLIAYEVGSGNVLNSL